MTHSLSRFLLFLLILLAPLSAAAQFIPINEAQQQVTLQDEGELNRALASISDKGATANRRVQVILAEVSDQKIGPSAAARKMEPIIGQLKTELNEIINAFAKKQGAANQVRVVYNAAQETLDSLRRQAGEILDQAGFDKDASPDKLSGKYLEYQKKINEQTTKAIEGADDRLTSKGSKATVKADLDKLIKNTEQQIDIVTASFLAVNQDVLPSAIERIKKGSIEAFSKAMAERLKVADNLPSSKELDLSEEDQSALTQTKQEIAEQTDRAINTVESLVSQVAQANLPTSSNVPGDNPLLNAKFRVQKQVDSIQLATSQRITSIVDRFSSDSDIAQLAKDILTKYAEQEKSRFKDAVKEYLSYFTAGDPTRDQYARRKRELQKKAEGCDSFLCDIGRVVSGVGSAFIAESTGGLVKLPTDFISSNVFQVREPQYGIGGAYSGYTSQGQNPQCVGLAEPSAARLGFGLVGIAKAGEADGSTGTQVIGSTDVKSFLKDSTKSSKTSTGGTTTAGSKNSTTSGGSSGGIGGFLGGLVNNPTTRNQVGNFIFSTLSGSSSARRQAQASPCYGQPNGYPGAGANNLPWGGYNYQMRDILGLPNNEFDLNVSQQTFAYQLARSLEILIDVNPRYAASYTQAIRILDNPTLSTQQKLNQTVPILRQTDFFQLSPDSSSNNVIVDLFLNLCTYARGGNQNLVELCRLYFRPKTTPGTFPGNPTLPGSNEPARDLRANANPLLQATADLNFYDRQVRYYGSAQFACQYREQMNNVALAVERLEPTIVNSRNYGSDLINELLSLRQQISEYQGRCSGSSRSGSTGGFNEDDLSTKDIGDLASRTTRQAPLVTAQRTFATVRLLHSTDVTDRGRDFLINLENSANANLNHYGVQLPAASGEKILTLLPGTYEVTVYDSRDYSNNRAGLPASLGNVNFNANEIWCLTAGLTIETASAQRCQ